MVTTKDVADLGRDESTSDVLPSNPWDAVAYNLGMRLGVDDFEVEQGYHRGKHRMHGAWLHGAGAIWGLEVKVAGSEIRVSPGLAVDSVGRELHLAAPWCVDVVRWYQKHSAEADVQQQRLAHEQPSSGGVLLDLHVVASFRSHRARPVPVVADPNGHGETAPSRVEEAMTLSLRAGLAPAPPPGSAPPGSFSRVRSLFHRLAAAERPQGVPDEVRAWLERLQQEPTSARAETYREALFDLGYRDQREIQPVGYQDGGHGGDGDDDWLPPAEEVVLAELAGIVIPPASTAGQAIPCEVLATRRPALLPQRLLQDLLCAAMAAATPPKDAGGPRVTHVHHHHHRKRIVLHFSHPLRPESVSKHAFSVSELVPNEHWREVPIVRVVPAVLEDYRIDEREMVVRDLVEITPHGIVEIESIKVTDLIIDIKEEDWTRVTIELGEGCRGELLRILARGTGPMPLLDDASVPLAGGMHDGPGYSNNGRDFVLQSRLNR